MSLVGTAFLTMSGSALAGQTRILDIRSPGQADPILVFNDASVGNLTKTDIIVSNNGKQNLSKAHLYIGLAPATALSGVTVDKVFDIVGAATCTTTSTSVDCDFGSLTAKGPGKTRELSVTFRVTTAGAHSIDAAIKVAETVQDVGSNQNFQTAAGSFTAGAASCNSLGTFLFAPEADTLLIPTTTDGCANDTQRSGLELKGGPNGAGESVVSLDDSTDAANCATGYSCFGKAVSATVNGGANITPYLTWQIFYANSVLGNINPNRVAFDHAGTVILAGNKGLCKTATSTDCQEPYLVTPGGVTFFIRTETNGLIKGMN